MSKITIFKDTYETKNPQYIHIRTALNRIAEGKSKERVEKIRSGEKKEKLFLPCVLFSGEFTQRTDDSLFEHSGFVVLDFDHVDVAQTKNTLALDDYVYSCWASPSGNGVKALVEITNTERHDEHFNALTRYFDERYGLEIDQTGRNLSRMCYESYDPEIVIKGEYSKFGKFSSSKDSGNKSQVIDYQAGTTNYKRLNVAVMKVASAPDGEKHKALLEAARLCGGFIAGGIVEEDEAKRILLREICKRDIDSEASALSTIIDGIEDGKRQPIFETLNSERQMIRDAEVNDGDMSFISSDDDDFKWIEDFARGDIETGLTTGNEMFDKYFVYKKEFVVINGHSNVGKTTVALYLIANSTVRHNWKWVIYSSENKTASVKKLLMEFRHNKKVNNMTHMERKAAYKWVLDHFVVISNKDLLSYSDILLYTEKVMANSDIDGVFVDPYNSLRIDLGQSSLSSHEYHYEAASEFLKLSKNRNVAIWVNMHAVTEAQRRKGDDGLPVAPFAEDTEGGGKFVNRADCFLTVHRKVQAQDPHTRGKTEIHVRKVRETETGGQPTPYDDPFLMFMDTSKTAFKAWVSQSPLFQVSVEEVVKPIPFNLNFMSEKSASD